MTPKQRFRILNRDGHRCQLCGRRAPDVELEIDHIIPRSKGGTDFDTNLRALCRECNLGKRDALSESPHPQMLNAAAFLIEHLDARHPRIRAALMAFMVLAEKGASYEESEPALHRKYSGDRDYLLALEYIDDYFESLEKSFADNK